MKIDIAKVQAMSEEEQDVFLREYGYGRSEVHWRLFINGRFSLADLAFRMRDEADPQKYKESTDRVFCAKLKLGMKMNFCDWEKFMSPIDMILAALTAMEK